MLYHYSFQIVVSAHWQDVKLMPHLKSEQKCAMLGTSGQACKSLSVDILPPSSTSSNLKPTPSHPTGFIPLILTAVSGDACLVCTYPSSLQFLFSLPMAE